VEQVSGEAGNFTVTLRKRPRYIIEERCTGCTTCVEYCPVMAPDPFNQDLSSNKAIHIYFSQAVPLITYVDPQACLYLKEKKCLICESVCQNKAIDFLQTEEHLEIRVGAVILAPGFKPFDPRVREEYGYGRLANVVTSLDFERLLCATGPHEGEILRPSDRTHPKRIAWLQCVGSRRVTPGDNPYCSAVCCTYTQKQVILTKDHYPDVECTVFHNDIRSFGKDFERYRQRTEQLDGVRFIRSYAAVTGESLTSKNIRIRYADPQEGVKEEEFDLVVLSVGLTPPAEFDRLARVFGIELNGYHFCRTDPFRPLETTRPGVFVSGAFLGPSDIPESVFSASGAGSLCGALLAFRRGKLAQEREYPEEADLSREEPRIGVFVCHCGANIGRVVDVPACVEYALTLPQVVYAQEQLFSCATNSAKEITDKIKEKGLNRVVIAACSPRTLESLFRDTLREAGINPYFLEMANIREHCSWVHSKEKEEATRKAMDQIRMSVARSRCLEPLMEIDLPVHKDVLIVGGGLAGMTCALTVAEQGHQVYLLEKEAELGGTARRLHYTLEGEDVQARLKDLIRKVYRHPRIHVHTRARIVEAAGYVGNFITRVQSEKGTYDLKHGAVVIAVGADLYRPDEYLYGQNDRVLTLLELEDRIGKGDEEVLGAETLVMIQCVGCRNEDRNYCSRICCSAAVKNALKLKALKPQMEIVILFRDMMTYGLKEDYYREASEKEVRFVRYTPEDKPRLEEVEEEGRRLLRVTVTDPVLEKRLVLDADYLVLAAAVIPASTTTEVANLFKVTLNPDGFFKEAHVKLRPVEFGTDGVYLCGMAHYPKTMTETISQAMGTAGRVLTLLSHDTVAASGAVCTVEEDRCVSCGACISACTYGAITFVDTPQGKKAWVNPVLCKGDGLCNSKCATGAIQLKHYTDREILEQIEAAA
jgi:heterodisulfide reductase subunit A